MDFATIDGINRMLIYIYANNMFFAVRATQRRQSDITQPNDEMVAQNS